MKLSRIAPLLLVIVALSFPSTVRADDFLPARMVPPVAATPPLDSNAPTGPIDDSDDQDQPVADDSAPVATPEETQFAPTPAAPRHYSMDDLVASTQSLAADYSDGTHYTMSDIGGL